jgi:hypothetical protein
MCATTCPGGIQIQCIGPGNCGGDPCCVTFVNMKPTSILCTTSPSACVPNFNLGGGGMSRLCNSDGDCTSGGVMTNYNQCCHSTAAGTKFCFNSGLTGLTGGQIACP